MNVNQVSKHHILALFIAVITAIALSFACSPETAFAVSPDLDLAVEVGENPSATPDEPVSSESTDASLSAPIEDSTSPSPSTLAENPDVSPIGASEDSQATPDSVQAAPSDGIQFDEPAEIKNNEPNSAEDGKSAKEKDDEPSDARGDVTANTDDDDETEQDTLPLLIIVVGFDNIAYSTDIDWGQAIFTGEDSLVDYYDDMSLGQFTFVPMNETCSYENGDTSNEADKVNDGIVHVTLENCEHYDWTDLAAEIWWTTFGPTLVEAIKAADAFVDFAAYDADGDGALSEHEAALGFVIAGYEAAKTPDYSEHGADCYLWSHAYLLDVLLGTSDYYQPDGVSVSRYISIPEYEKTGVRSSIGTLAHELGHYLSLPDLYDVIYQQDVAWSAYSVQYLCLMDFGSWGSTLGGKSIPGAMGAPSRYLLGWLDPIELHIGDELLISPQDFSASPGSSGYVCAIIPIDGRDGEFYLVENRSYSGWDAAIQWYYGPYAPNGGLVFWHVDMNMYTKYPTNVNGADHHPSFMPLLVEVSEENKAAIIGNMPFINLALFDAAVWDKYAKTLGDYLVLPLYGTDPENDVPAARTLSEICVYFEDVSGEGVRIRLEKAPCRHVDIEHCDAIEPTCETEGSIEHWMCTECGQLFEDELGEHPLSKSDIVIGVLDHVLLHFEAIDATCENSGSIEYWQCEHCGKLFSDSAGKNEIQPSDTTINATGHRLVYVEGKPATNTADGVKEHWKCEVCQKLFTDEDATQAISPDDAVIPAKGNSPEAAPAKATPSKVALSSINSLKVGKDIVIPEAGDPIYVEGCIVIIGCSLVLLVICLVRRRHDGV